MRNGCDDNNDDCWIWIHFFFFYSVAHYELLFLRKAYSEEHHVRSFGATVIMFRVGVMTVLCSMF